MTEEKRISQMIDIRDIQKAHNGHWFDAEAIRFFKSRTSTYGYQFKDIAFFVSSEQFDYQSPRLYTIRAVNMKDGSFLSISNFQNYTKSQTAWKELKEYLRLLEPVQLGEEFKHELLREQIIKCFYTEQGKVSDYRPCEEILKTCEAV